MQLTSNSDKITRDYFDSLLIETRYLDAVLPTTEMTLFGETFRTPIMTANTDFLAENPEAAKAFMAATAKGYEYAIENPEEAAQILIDGDNTGSLKGSEELVLASQKWMCDQYKAEVDRWGYIDPARWDAFYTWLTENDLCAKPLEPGTGFTNDFLP